MLATVDATKGYCIDAKANAVYINYRPYCKATGKLLYPEDHVNAAYCPCAACAGCGNIDTDDCECYYCEMHQCGAFGEWIDQAPDRKRPKQGIVEKLLSAVNRQRARAERAEAERDKAVEEARVLAGQLADENHIMDRELRARRGSRLTYTGPRQ